MFFVIFMQTTHIDLLDLIVNVCLFVFMIGLIVPLVCTVMSRTSRRNIVSGNNIISGAVILYVIYNIYIIA